MAKIAKTADRKKVMDTTKSTDCPKCGKPTRIVKRVKDRERNVPELERQTAIEKGRAEDERWHIRKNRLRFWVAAFLSR